MFRAVAALCGLCAFASASLAQTGLLTDDRIVSLAKGGLTEQELIARIRTAPAVDFLLTPNWTEYMMQSGVSEEVIKAMAARESPGASPTAAQPQEQDSGSQPIVPAVMPTDQPAVFPVTSSTNTGSIGGRTRIFIGETTEWQASSFNVAHSAATFSAFSGSAGAGSFGMSHAGLMKLTVSVMNQVNQHCPGVVIVNRPDSADLFVRLDQSTSMWTRHDDMAVFNRAGEMIFVTATHSISKDAKRFCKSMVGTKP